MESRVLKLKEYLTLSKLKHSQNIMREQTLKGAHIYCVVNNLSAQQYGPLLEKYISTKFGYTKINAKESTGDCSKNGKNFEVKVSLGGSTHTKFNFVQIRPSHGCDSYIMTAYHLCNENVENEGELYIFNVPKEGMKQLVVKHGGYAHGTVKEHGEITVDSVNEKSNKEYALRPIINDSCWNDLLPFRITEELL